MKLPRLSSGIYFLILGDQVVYVGQSEFSVFTRIGTHTRDKEFDSFHYIEVDSEGDNLSELEAFYILQYLPVYNKSIPSNPRFVLESRIRKTFDCDPWILKKFIKNMGIQSFHFPPQDNFYFDLEEMLDKGLIDSCANTKKVLPLYEAM